nr:hypothetical protein [Parvularcula dongshanensis]
MDRAGPPVVRRRTPGYPGLFRIITEQQLSVPSARAILARCHAKLGEPTPSVVLAASDDALRGCGLSRPKIRYLRAAADAVAEGTLDLEGLGALSDEDAARHLVAVPGVGPWTAAIYLLFCDGRLDVWPKSDVALLASYAAASGFAAKPAQRDFDAEADRRYAPWRGVAAHVLWTHYAVLKGRKPG